MEDEGELVCFQFSGDGCFEGVFESRRKGGVIQNIKPEEFEGVVNLS